MVRQGQGKARNLFLFFALGRFNIETMLKTRVGLSLFFNIISILNLRRVFGRRVHFLKFGSFSCETILKQVFIFSIRFENKCQELDRKFKQLPHEKVEVIIGSNYDR